MIIVVKLKSYILSLRKGRVVHHWLGTTLALLLFISAVTGVLLAYKKEVGLIQPPTQKGQSVELSNWIPLDQIAAFAIEGLVEHQPEQVHNPVSRMDIRPDKGVIKVLFEKGYWEVQVDGKTGAVLSVARRHSDWIEALHDGSIIGDLFKLLSMNFLGIGLLFLIGTGLWLWYGPKVIRRKKQRNEE